MEHVNGNNKWRFFERYIREIFIEALSPQRGYLMRLQHLSVWLKATKNYKLEQEIIMKMDAITENLNFYRRYHTTEGAVIKAVHDLYDKFPSDLVKRLNKIMVPLDFRKILADKNTYARLMTFYHETMAGEWHLNKN